MPKRAVARGGKRRKRPRKAEPLKSEEEQMRELVASGFNRLDEEALTVERAMLFYSINQFLWVRLSDRTRSALSSWKPETLRSLFERTPDSFAKRWSVENSGEYSKEDLGVAKVLAAFPDKSFYCSTILQNDPETIGPLFESLQFETPSLLTDARHDDGAWLFLGAGRGDDPLTGRAEHVDAIKGSGTWHIQVRGSKTWLIRPDPHAESWEGCPPELDGLKHAEQSASGGRAWRLRINVEAGDLLVLNTSAWYHRTELGKCADLSISMARDFHLSDDGPASTNDDEGACEEKENAPDAIDPRALAARAFCAGEVLLVGADIPEAFPCSLEPNCELSVNAQGHGELRSLLPISEGDVLTVAPEDDAEYEEVEVDFSSGSGLVTARAGSSLGDRL